MVAPPALYSSSEKPLPFPAPACTKTSCPSLLRTAAPDGVIPTRYSLSLISVGTPIRIARLSLAGAYSSAARQRRRAQTGRPSTFDCRECKTVSYLGDE